VSSTLSPQLDFCDVDCWSILIVLARVGSGASISSSWRPCISKPNWPARLLPGPCRVSQHWLHPADPYRHFYIYIYISRPHCKSFFARVWKKLYLSFPHGRHTHLPMCRLLAPVPCPGRLVCLARTRPRLAVKVVTTFCRGHFKSRPVFPSPCRPF